MINFKKPYKSADLQLLKSASITVGEVFSVPEAFYPEAFYRLKVTIKNEADLYCDLPDIVAESSGLFWDFCTNAQTLMYAESEQHVWTLALTRFGGLRWELRGRNNQQILAELEVEPITHLLDINFEFHLGLTLTSSENQHIVRLLVGQNDGMIIEAESTELPEQTPALADFISIGCGPNNHRPFSGKIEEILVANTTRYQLYDRPELGDVIDGTFPGGSVLAPVYVNDKTISVLPGAQFSSTSNNSWYYFLLNDSRVSNIIIEESNGMNGHFFTSEDQDKWTAVPKLSMGKGVDGKRCSRLKLPERKEGLYIASAMVYGELERNRDLQKAKELGATVQQVATSTLGLPVHIVTLTNEEIPLLNKKAVVLHCGQHAPLEQMGGRLGMPCLEELIKINEKSSILDSFVFYWVPIFNIDCAHFGTPGNDARCTNPNRHWHENKGPEHIGVQKFLTDQAYQGVDMRFLLDVHMGGWRNHNLLPFYITTGPEEIDITCLSGRNAEKGKHINALRDICGLREIWSNTTQADNPNNCPAWFQSTFDSYGMVIEGSVSTYFDPVQNKTLPFTAESFVQLGRNLAHFFTSDAVLKS